ncbi:hypothetical protein ABE10_03325, partial [Bacillus toyonensis]|nr:hypothetical protein [Bacillus toyonensis]
VVAGEEERAEDLARVGLVQIGRRGHHVLQHGSRDVEVLVLLRVVAHLQAVPRLEPPGVRLVDAGEDAQQRGLPRPVQTEHDDLGAAVDREVDVGEDLQRAVGLAET